MYAGYMHVHYALVCYDLPIDVCISNCIVYILHSYITTDLGKCYAYAAVTF